MSDIVRVRVAVIELSGCYSLYVVCLALLLLLPLTLPIHEHMNTAHGYNI